MSALNANREKYPHIVRWGRMMGSYDYFIDAQCDLAAFEKAPEDAIYRASDGTWRTLRDLSESHPINSKEDK